MILKKEERTGFGGCSFFLFLAVIQYILYNKRNKMLNNRNNRGVILMEGVYGGVITMWNSATTK